MTAVQIQNEQVVEEVSFSQSAREPGSCCSQFTEVRKAHICPEHVEVKVRTEAGWFPPPWQWKKVYVLHADHGLLVCREVRHKTRVSLLPPEEPFLGIFF